MAGIDIFSIQPHKISSDLAGKSFLFFGLKKTGKTTNACKFPKPILLAFEKGYEFIDGVIAQPINNWKEALQVKKQLLKDMEQAKEEGREPHFTSVVVDTCDLAYDYCERYILDREGVQYLDETEKMRGYRALSREFDLFFQDLMRAGYTLVIISHAVTKQVKEKGEKYERTIPSIPDRGMQVISRLVDICAYVAQEEDENGQDQTMLIMRGNKYLESGSRNPYTSEKIPFTYEALRADMAQAVEKMKENGSTVIETPSTMLEPQSEKVDFKKTQAEIKAIAKVLNSLDKMDAYGAIVTEYLGKGRSVKDCDESQADMLALILEDLREYVKENNIEV